MTWARATALAASLCLHGAVLALAWMRPGAGPPGPDAGGDAAGIFSPDIASEPDSPAPQTPFCPPFPSAPTPDTFPDIAQTPPADMVLPLDNGVPVPALLPPTIHHLPPSAGTRTRHPSGAGAGIGSVWRGGRGGGNGGGGGDYIPPTYLDNPPPAYPLAARLAGHTGIVLLEVVVDDSGRPAAVTVVRSSGDPALDRAAVTAVQRWRFHPALAAGRPVTARVEFPVRFCLK